MARNITNVPRLLFTLALLLPGLVLAQSPNPELKAVRLGRDGLAPSVDKVSLPIYPAELSGGRGTVDFEIVVGTKGTVLHSRLTSRGASEALVSACLDALGRTKFRSARDGSGRQVPSLVAARFEFDASRAAADRVSLKLGALPRLSAPAGAVTASASESTPPAAGASIPKPGGGVNWPSTIREVLPQYTPVAMRAKLQGEVELEVIVGDDGTVRSARVTKPFEDSLDGEALIAVRYWLFNPGTKDGHPVATRVTVVMEFRLH